MSYVSAAPEVVRSPPSPVDLERPYFESRLTGGVITGGFGFPKRLRARN
jgi:hypothetical protein